MNNGNMNDNGYQVFHIDAENKRIFVTRKPIVPKDKDEDWLIKADSKAEENDFINLPISNPGFRAADCEVVDITDWEYESYENLIYQINNYESVPKRK